MRRSRRSAGHVNGWHGLIAVFLLPLLNHAVAAMTDSLSLETLVSRSEVAVHGSVLSIRSAWNEGRNLIVSYVTLQVVEVLQGTPPPGLVVVRVAGGVLPEEDLGMRVSGAPEFQSGEEVVVLLERPSEAGLVREGMAPAFYRVTGGSLGKFEIRSDRQTGAKQAFRSPGFVVGQRGAVAEVMPLDRLRELIRGATSNGPR